MIKDLSATAFLRLFFVTVNFRGEHERKNRNMLKKHRWKRQFNVINVLCLGFFLNYTFESNIHVSKKLKCIHLFVARLYKDTIMYPHLNFKSTFIIIIVFIRF